MPVRTPQQCVRWTFAALCTLTGCATASPGQATYASTAPMAMAPRTEEAASVGDVPSAMPSAMPSTMPSPGAVSGGEANARTAVASAAGPGAALHGASTGAEGGTGTVAPAPMLIYVANIALQTAHGEVVHTLDRVVDLAVGLGGYLVQRTDTSVQVGMPSVRFREGLGRVETLGEVLHRSVTAEDVSEEYRDLDVRLQNLHAVRTRLEGLLAHAGSLQDTLSVEHELERVTREIDTLEGRMRYLGARVAYSLVTVNVQPSPPVMVAPSVVVPGRRAMDLPVEWLAHVGLDHLLQLR